MRAELDAEPVPLTSRKASTRRNKWSSVPPPSAPAPKRSLFSIAVIGAVWVAVGAASVAYVVTRNHASLSERSSRSSVTPSDAAVR